MWNLPGPGLEPVSSALAGRFLITAMAVSLLSCPFPSFLCGRPPPDSGHSPTQGFRVNRSELWPRQPRQDFTQISRNRSICLTILLKLRKIYDITFLHFPTCLNGANKNPSGHWEITLFPPVRQQVHTARWVNSPWATYTLPLPPAAATLTGCVAFPLQGRESGLTRWDWSR